jgi:hypothetical protein
MRAFFRTGNQLKEDEIAAGTEEPSAAWDQAPAYGFETALFGNAGSSLRIGRLKTEPPYFPCRVLSLSLVFALLFKIAACTARPARLIVLGIKAA